MDKKSRFKMDPLAAIAKNEFQNEVCAEVSKLGVHITKFRGNVVTMIPASQSLPDTTILQAFAKGTRTLEELKYVFAQHDAYSGEETDHEALLKAVETVAVCIFRNHVQMHRVTF